MKKIIFAAFVIAAVAACNSPQEITSPSGDSSNMTPTAPVDSTPANGRDTMMGGDTMKNPLQR